MVRRSVLLLAVAFPCLVGCVHFTKSTAETDATRWRLTDEAPQESKSCVYVFMIESLNPWAPNLSGLPECLHRLGFIKTFVGKPPHRTYFAEKMHWLRNRCASARFAVIGCAGGAQSARQLAVDMESSGVPVDFVLFIEPPDADSWQQPSDETKWFMVRAADLPKPAHHPESKLHAHSEKETSAALHPATLDLLERELTLLALSVPPPQRPAERQVILVPPVPAPRTRTPMPRELPEEWQFLRPKYPWEIPSDAPRNGNQILPPPKALPELPLPKEKP